MIPVKINFEHLLIGVISDTYCLQDPRKISNFALVNGLEHHIESLLLHNDCVIVPELGGFVAHHVDAQYSIEEQLFLPPKRTLGFNPQLTMNDSLLVQSYIETYDISYPEALGRIEQEVALLRSLLDEQGHCELEGLGVLYKNQEGKLSFLPCEAGILTPSLYALDSFELKSLDQDESQDMDACDTKAVVVMRDENSGQRRISVSLRALRNTAVAACVLAICVFVIAPMRVQQPENDFRVQSGMFSCLYEGQSRRVKAQPMKLSLGQNTKSSTSLKKKPWTIVLCTQVPMSGAKTFCSNLKAQGLTDTRILEQEGSVKVVYGAYASEAEALAVLQRMKTSNFFNTAWVLHIGE